jgi:hypothetical protein
MISAFGVEHGVSKSWKKLAPKLAKVQQTPRRTDDIQQRMKVNYYQGRARGAARSKAYQANVRGLKQRQAQPEGTPLRDYRIGRNIEDRDKALKEGKFYKDFANAAIAGHSNAGKRKRFLP